MATYKSLIEQSSNKVNQAAKTSDPAARQKLIDEAKALKAEADAIKKKESAVDAQSTYDKAVAEIKRLSALPSETAGVSASIQKQEQIKTQARKNGAKVTIESATTSTQNVPTKPADASSSKVSNTSTAKDSVASPAAPTITKDANGNVITKGKVRTPLPAKDVAPKNTPKPSTKLTIDEIYSKAAAEFGAIDTIFKSNPELASLMTQAVTEGWKPARWASELQNTNWFKSNATDLQQRGFYKRQYTELMNAIPAGAADRDTQIAALDGSTTYGRGLASIKRLIQAEAISEGAVIEDAALTTLAQDIYDHALEKDSLAIRDYVKAKIKYQPGKILSGKAGEDLATLKQTAAANGLDIDKAFGTSLQGWLQKLAGGESVETYKNIIRQAAKAGLPERVGSLLDNGVDLETIYTPYKNILANTLEINPASITLNDPTLRSAIGPDKEMSLYDYQRSLRQDARWQYTNNAREETSNAVMKVLQDFGFKG
jgi:hypothetical protein